MKPCALLTPLNALLKLMRILFLNSVNYLILSHQMYSETKSFCLARSSFHFIQTTVAQGTGKVKPLMNSKSNLYLSYMLAWLSGIL